MVYNGMMAKEGVEVIKTRRGCAHADPLCSAGQIITTLGSTRHLLAVGSSVRMPPPAGANRDTRQK